MLEERKLGSSSIIVRMSVIRKLSMEATENGLLAPELAAGIARKVHVLFLAVANAVVAPAVYHQNEPAGFLIGASCDCAI
jgi:hypothetical protein